MLRVLLKWINQGLLSTQGGARERERERVKKPGRKAVRNENDEALLPRGAAERMDAVALEVAEKRGSKLSAHVRSC